MISSVVLRVDLSAETVSKELVPLEWRREYAGGDGINARLLWDHFLRVSPKIDPLSSDNVLIAGMGLLGGTGFGAGSKMKFTFKSPAYNMFGDTCGGGGLGSQLRWSGYDHVVITGKAKRPVYLWVNNDVVEIREASGLWGKSTPETEHAIREATGDQKADIACIGQAGENLVRTAAIILDGHRAAGRGGGGCVFGSKNLKAIAAHGTRGIQIHDPKAFFQAIDDFLSARRQAVPDLLAERKKDSDVIDRRMRHGSLFAIRRFHEMGFNTYRNGQGRKMPDRAADRLDHNWYARNIAVRALCCSPGCAFACGAWHHIRGNESVAAGRYSGEWGTRPEYGAANPFGSACDVADMPAVAHFNKMCNDYGLDTMETGMSIALFMELWDRAIITEADVAGWAGEALPLDWGNFLSVERAIRAIALQENKLGEILKGGVYKTALNVSNIKGIDVVKYASYGKGGATHEGPARPWPSLGVDCAVTQSPNGWHCVLSPGASMKYLGSPDGGDTFSANLKGASQAITHTLKAISNSLGICGRVSGSDPDVVPIDLLARALDAATGITMSGDELFRVGERVVNLKKAFASRLGLRREHDTVCHRWMSEPQLEGAAKGMKVGNYLEAAKDEYYERRGWDKATSLQTRQKLGELGMTDIIEVLEQENTLV